MLRTRFAVAALLGVALAAAAGGQDRAFTLKFKDDKGTLTPFYQEMSTEVTQHIKVQGQDLPQQQKSTFWYAWTPVKEDKVKEGAEDVVKWTLKQKIEGLKMDIDISGNPIKYDSRVPDTAETKTPTGIGFYCNDWPTDPAWRFVALGLGHDVDYWTRFLRALVVVDPDMFINVEHEDASLGQLEGLALSAQNLLTAAAHI